MVEVGKHHLVRRGNTHRSMRGVGAVIHESFKDKIFNCINMTLLCIVMLVFMYPLIYVVSSSLSSFSARVAGRVWLFPVDFTTAGYSAVFQYDKIWLGYKNSLLYVCVGTAVSVVLTVLAGYSLSRKDLKGRTLITFLFTFTMLFRGGLIPEYMVVRSLGMLDTRWALIIPGAITVWNLIITRTYFQTTIPSEMLDASRIDGCSDARFLLSVVVPLSGPIISVIGLFYAVQIWNAYFPALLYLTRERLFPLQIFLRDALIQNANLVEGLDIEKQLEIENLTELMKYSIIIIASLPVLILYPFVQRFFVKGMMIGAIKG